MRQMLRERAREKICTRASAGSTEMRKLRGPLRVRDACSARGGAALGTRWGAGPLTGVAGAALSPVGVPIFRGMRGTSAVRAR